MKKNHFPLQFFSFLSIFRKPNINLGFIAGNMVVEPQACVVPAKALMPTMLVQEHRDKTITHTVHEVLTWFGQPCLHQRMRDTDSTIQ